MFSKKYVLSLELYSFCFFSERTPLVLSKFVWCCSAQEAESLNLELQSPLGFVWNSKPSLAKLPAYPTGSELPGFPSSQQEMLDWNYELKRQTASDKTLKLMQQNQSLDLCEVSQGKQKKF